MLRTLHVGEAVERRGGSHMLRTLHVGEAMKRRGGSHMLRTLHVGEAMKRRGGSHMLRTLHVGEAVERREPHVKNTICTVGAKKHFPLRSGTTYVERKKYHLETHVQRKACVLQDAYYAPFI